MTRRIIGSVLILIFIFVMPYWIYIPFLFIGIILFPFFWEGIVFVFLIDVVYGGTVETFANFISPLAVFVLIALIVMLPVRESLRSHV